MVSFRPEAEYEKCDCCQNERRGCNSGHWRIRPEGVTLQRLTGGIKGDT
jgi:hypothetical protein